jgi:hypothetical protein
MTIFFKTKKQRVEGKREKKKEDSVVLEKYTEQRREKR